MWKWTNYNDELYHFGIKGMNWGERRYQNEDGSLTPAGRAHYGVGEAITKAKGLAGKIGSGLKSAGSKAESGVSKAVDKTRGIAGKLGERYKEKRMIDKVANKIKQKNRQFEANPWSFPRQQSRIMGIRSVDNSERMHDLKVAQVAIEQYSNSRFNPAKMDRSFAERMLKNLDDAWKLTRGA